MTLNLVLGLPIVAGLTGYLMRQKGARGFGILVTVIQLVLLKTLLFGGEPDSLTFLAPWIPELGLNWSLGIDGANQLLLLLTPLFTLLAILSRPQDSPHLASFVASLLLLDGFLCGLFMAQNLGLFYIFFEAMLLPALILVAGWSKKEGHRTAMKFLLFTLVGSLPMLLGVLTLAFTGTASSLEFSELTTLAPERQYYLFFPFLLAFLVKMPIVPLHGWLPTLYRNAPATVTVVIAALMSKAGTYGLMKVGFTVFPDALVRVGPGLCLMAVISILYGALAALGSDSVKEILAYSSLSHIAMIALGLFSNTLNGVAGAGLQMAGHAIATGGLFLVVALMENRGLPDQFRRYGGLVKATPKLAVFALFLTLASLGQPGLGSFPGELYILTGVWLNSKTLAVLASAGIILAAAYLLRWYQKIFTGETGIYRTPEDLKHDEAFLLSIPILLSLALGFFPSAFLQSIQGWIERVM